MITEGYLARHYQGRHGGRGPAIIDIALISRCGRAEEWLVRRQIESLGQVGRDDPGAQIDG